MTKNELIADLRNKLSPIKTYLAAQREYESLSANDDSGFMDGYKLAQLKEIIQTNKLIAEVSMIRVEVILEYLEKLD